MAPIAMPLRTPELTVARSRKRGKGKEREHIKNPNSRGGAFTGSLSLSLTTSHTYAPDKDVASVAPPFDKDGQISRESLACGALWQRRLPILHTSSAPVELRVCVGLAAAYVNVAVAPQPTGLSRAIRGSASVEACARPT